MSEQGFRLQAGRTDIEVTVSPDNPAAVQLSAHQDSGSGPDEWVITDLTPDQARALGEALLKAAGADRQESKP